VDKEGLGTVVIRGGGDIGTGVAHKLYRSGFDVIIVETENPLVIRRKVAFAQAVFDGQMIVEDVKAFKALNKEEINTILKEGNIPVMVDPDCSIVSEINPEVVVDATLAKKNTGMHKDLAPLTIALGPGFKAGEDVDVVIETNRGHNLGRIIFEGCVEPNTGIPEAVMGYREERVLRAPCDGKIRAVLDIGDRVTKGETVCYVGKETVKASLNGVVRGIIMNGINVKKGLKIGDIDPRGIKGHCYTISDKARAVGGGVLEAILSMKKSNKL
jgi:xanthine dehydrogenase accessory factor